MYLTSRKEFLHIYFLTFSFLLVGLWKTSYCNDEFVCHPALVSDSKKEIGAIYPRGDIIVDVGGPAIEVLCHFNNEFINSSDVFFIRKDPYEILPHKTINASTILTVISHSQVAYYKLQCMLKRKSKNKRLCRQRVYAGYPPQDIENFTCLSKNYEDLNCTWTLPKNPIPTYYTLKYEVPNYHRDQRCPSSNGNSCYWSHANKINLSKDIYLHFFGKNILGEVNFTREVHIPEYVLPDKIPVKVTVFNQTKANVMWNLSFPIDILGMWHRVDYRLSTENQWHNVELFNSTFVEFPSKRLFSTIVDLPYPYVKYDFRVQLHTLAANFSEKMWSDYDIISVMTDSLRPTVAPNITFSGFEVISTMLSRDIQIHFKDMDYLFHNGEDFHYKILVYHKDQNEPLDIKFSNESLASFKFTSMNFTEYKFEIIPANEKGDGYLSSKIIIPKRDCMPKVTERFTAIRTNEESIFSFYWLPSKMSNEECPGSASTVDSYTLFWCKTNNGKCKDKLSWRTYFVEDLRKIPLNDTIVYEKNLTGLHDESYFFGIASNSGNYSSGIRRSSCYVHEYDLPPAPTSVQAISRNSTSVEVNWDLTCPVKSTFIIGYNVSYCQADKPDFGHCQSEEYNVVVWSFEPKSANVTENLTPGISYIFSVSLLSYRNGEGYQSQPYMVTMPDNKPMGPPLDVRISDSSITSTSAILEWRSPTKELRGGYITQFKISYDDVKIMHKITPGMEDHLFQKTLNHLVPYKNQTIMLVACTKKGCSDSTAQVKFQTKEGSPPKVKDFDIDVSNWKLIWKFDRCNSLKCEFEIEITSNKTTTARVISDERNVFNLRDEGLDCVYEEMTFRVRAIGTDAQNNTFYGNWTNEIKKDPSHCPTGGLSGWLIGGISSLCAVVTVVILIIMKCGWGSIKELVKNWKLRINLPEGLKDDEFPKGPNLTKRIVDDDYILDKKDSEDFISNTLISNEEKHSEIRPRNSVSSEQILIDNNDVERHGRNLSGSSDRSSAQDSAVVSESPSSENDPILRQRISQGPQNGYITARSVPCFQHIYENEEGLMPPQSSTLNGSLKTFDVLPEDGLGLDSSLLPRRASVGYHSFENESGKTSPFTKDPTPEFISMPIYARHSFDPINLASMKDENQFPEQKRFRLNTGIVTIAAPPPMTPNGNIGYVSVSDGFRTMNDFSTSLNDDETTPTAYCKVGSREVEANQPRTAVANSSPYVTHGDARLFGSQGLNLTSGSPYVQVSDAGKSAPQSNQRTDMVNPTSNRTFGNFVPSNTPESVNGYNRSPSLSKQSSGYVSQDSIPVVMSPKRLLAQSHIPHSVILSHNNEASMV